MDVIAKLPDCDGQAAESISAYTQIKMEDAPKLLRIPKSECLDFWIRLPRKKWPNSGSYIEDPVVLLERKLYGHLPCWALVGKTVRGSLNGTWMGKSAELGMPVCSSKTRMILIGI